MKKKYSTIPTAEKVKALENFMEEHRGKDIVALNLTHQNTFAEAMLVVSATSVRHAQSLAEGVQLFCKQENFEFLRMEGKQSGQWILLDLNDVVVSVFQEPVRELYQLEKLWTEIPARQKAASEKEHADDDTVTEG